MPAESKKAADPIAGSSIKNQPEPKKQSTSSSGKVALAKITLLDGSILDVSINVSWL